MQEGVAACLRTPEAGNLSCRSDSFDVQRLLIMKMFKLFSMSVVDSLRLAGMWDNNEDHRTINLQLVDFSKAAMALAIWLLTSASTLSSFDTSAQVGNYRLAEHTPTRKCGN